MTSRRSEVHPTYAGYYEVVACVPPGKVSTYGCVAELAGRPGYARQVGYALHALPAGSLVPWHRIVNARGEISLRRIGGAACEQERRLRAEGIRFDSRGRIALRHFGWAG